MLYHSVTMSRRRANHYTPLRLRRAVLAVAFVLLGFQLIGGSLHAAGTTHDPTAECQFCLALDRLDPPLASIIDAPICVREDVAVAITERTLISSQDSRPYAVRAPPAIRRF